MKQVLSSGSRDYKEKWHMTLWVEEIALFGGYFVSPFIVFI